MTVRPPLEERFYDHVDRAGPEDCWPFRGHRTPFGYGQITGFLGGDHVRAMPAHRVSWVVSRGPIPPGLFVCHHCDNPPCCNPAHLFLGTSKDNSQDRERKGRGFKASAVYPERMPRGEAHPRAKFTEDDVREIRRRRAAGESWKSLARAYGVRHFAIQSIVERRTWRHVA